MKKLLFLTLTVLFTNLGIYSVANYFSKSSQFLLCQKNSGKSGDSGNHRG